jgi:rhombotail lipoprotein
MLKFVESATNILKTTLSVSCRRIAASMMILLAISGCASQQVGSRSSVVDYLYPKEQQVAIEPGIAKLTLPLRVGIAFVPSERLHSRGANPWAFVDQGANSLTENDKQQMLERLADHFRQHDFIGDIQLIPSAYLRPQGSFANLDQLKSMFGIDVIALISFDQMQFSDESKTALSYWTLVGAYLVSDLTSYASPVPAAITAVVATRVTFHHAAKETFIQLLGALVGGSSAGV